MKIGKLILVLFAFLLLIAGAGFVYLMFAEVPVTQTEISKEIPHDSIGQ